MAEFSARWVLWAMGEEVSVEDKSLRSVCILGWKQRQFCCYFPVSEAARRFSNPLMLQEGYDYFWVDGANRFRGPLVVNQIRLILGDEVFFRSLKAFVDKYRGKQTDIELTRLEACETCRGSGAKKGTSPKTCPRCRGAGQVAYSRGFFRVATTCDYCQGEGTHIDSPCPECDGRGRINRRVRIKVAIPPGADNDLQLRLPGEGEAGIRGGPRGDLYAVIRVKEHPTFRREGDDLTLEVPITFTQAALGDTLAVPTLESETTLDLPAGCQSHRVFRLKGHGLPHLRRPETRGDLHVAVIVKTPTHLSEEQKQLFHRLAELEGKKPAPGEKGFFGKVKEFLEGQ
jgi:molecular chaperone DnaJ